MRKRKNEHPRPLPPGTKVKAQWVVYSTNREHCFKEEIQKGYFGSNHCCGCTSCDKQMQLPMPEFTRLPGEVR